jgi:glycosyltransferase involved in cell wall biosynthesis
MSEKPPITLAVPTHNRFALVLECVGSVIDDPRVGEIVLSDDCSTDGSYEALLHHFKDHPKVKLYRNKSNVDCYFNKRQAVELASSPWLILFDDDNVIKSDYLNVLFALPSWDADTVYCPEWAQPHFDYRKFAGVTVDKHSVHRYMHSPPFRTALNTCNYFVNRQSYLDVWDGSKNPHTADSIYQAHNWLRAGKKLSLVPGLRYFHRVHEGSHYKLNNKKTANFGKEVETWLLQMR